mgnify:CR=1 FL=1
MLPRAFMGWREGGVIVPLFVVAAGCASSTPASEARAAWTRACVRLAACEPFTSFERPYFECATFLLRRTDVATAECVARAASCEEAAACAGLASPDECGDNSRCEGDVLHACQFGRRAAGGGSRPLAWQRDCGAEGLTCRVIYPTYASTGFHVAACVAPGECAEDTCDGDAIVRCNTDDVDAPGVPIPSLCAAGVCREGACRGDGEACEGGSWCEGDVAVTCLGGRLVRERCYPGTCSPDPTGSWPVDGSTRCRARDECELRCEGSHVVRCVEGRLERYDCREWGFDACVVASVPGGSEPRCE